MTTALLDQPNITLTSPRPATIARASRAATTKPPQPLAQGAKIGSDAILVQAVGDTDESGGTRPSVARPYIWRLCLPKKHVRAPSSASYVTATRGYDISEGQAGDGDVHCMTERPIIKAFLLSLLRTRLRRS